MDIREQLQQEIEQFVENHSGNIGEDGGKYFDAPRVGFASAQDRLFEDYKRIIGPFHWTPSEILNQGAPTTGPREGTVVSWILPITEPVRISNRMEDRYPSRQWAHTRNFGELFNNEVRNMVVAFLTKQGGRAAAARHVATVGPRGANGSGMRAVIPGTSGSVKNAVLPGDVRAGGPPGDPGGRRWVV